MALYPESIERLIHALTTLPGVGRKTAERYVFHLLRQPPAVVEKIVQGLHGVQQDIHDCERCFNITVNTICDVCRDSQRDISTICVVSDSTNLHAIEQTGDYHGVYHVLGGVINQLDGIGPNQLRITELVERVHNDGAQEIIIATNPNVGGNATAMYVIEALKDMNVQVTRLAQGLPAGADIQYADDITLSNALKDRKDI